MSQTSTGPVPRRKRAPAAGGRQRARGPVGALGLLSPRCLAALWPVLDLNIAFRALHRRPRDLGGVLLTRSGGSRRATDRLVTCLVVTPSGWRWCRWSRWSGVSSAHRAPDGRVLQHSSSGWSAEGGGAYHAIMGTLVITALTALISVPIGLLTAIFLVEYARGRLKRAITFSSTS
jgi:phosphate transport system permease protein